MFFLLGLLDEVREVGLLLIVEGWGLFHVIVFVVMEAFFFVPVDGVDFVVDTEDVLMNLVDEVVHCERVEGAAFIAQVIERVEDGFFDELQVLSVAR